MKAVTVQVDPAALTAQTKEELVALFEREVEEFSTFMTRVPNWKQQGPLTRPEKILLLTYLMQKHAGKIDGGV